MVRIRIAVLDRLVSSTASRAAQLASTIGQDVVSAVAGGVARDVVVVVADGVADGAEQGVNFWQKLSKSVSPIIRVVHHPCRATAGGRDIVGPELSNIPRSVERLLEAVSAWSRRGQMLGNHNINDQIFQTGGAMICYMGVAAPPSLRQLLWLLTYCVSPMAMPHAGRAPAVERSDHGDNEVTSESEGAAEQAAAAEQAVEAGVVLSGGEMRLFNAVLELDVESADIRRDVVFISDGDATTDVVRNATTESSE